MRTVSKSEIVPLNCALKIVGLPPIGREHGETLVIKRTDFKLYIQSDGRFWNFNGMLPILFDWCVVMHDESGRPYASNVGLALVVTDTGMQIVESN
jgi:hypothetical protein